jgi:hypothetical protein
MVNNIKADLENLTIGFDNLFKPDDMAFSRYNSALATLFHVENTNRDITIDIRGYSPEIGKDKGKYLNITEVNPFVLIVSPDQYFAPLVDSAFSFKEKAVRFLYDKASNVINTLTTNEALWGALDNKLDMINDIRDLLLIDNVRIDLETPKSTLTKIRKLQEMHQNLEEYLLDDEKIKTMIAEHRHLNMDNYGDIREININGKFPINYKVGSFFTKMFDGVHIIRYDEGKTLFVHNGDKKKKIFDLPEGVITIKTDSKNLLDTLFDEKLIYYDISEKSLESAKKDIEDSVLLDNGFDIFPQVITKDMGESIINLNRKRGLMTYANVLPKIWYDINDMLKDVKYGKISDVRESIYSQSNDIKVTLAIVNENLDDNTKDTLNNLLLTLDNYPADYVKKAKYDRDNLIETFPAYNNTRKKYACYKLSKEE